MKAIGWDLTDKPTTLFCNNKAAIFLFKDTTAHTCMKHFDIKYHFLCEHANMGEIVIKYMNTQDNIADIFTKALLWPLFL